VSLGSSTSASPWRRSRSPAALGSPYSPLVALLPFVLALGPAAIAIAVAWREGHGAVRKVLQSLTIRPADRRWCLVLAIPVLWSLTTVLVAVGLGEPTTGLFDALFPAVLIIPLVVLLPVARSGLTLPPTAGPPRWPGR
jgi:hypothetical protein